MSLFAHAADVRGGRLDLAMAALPEATHLFEEPGTLDKATLLAREWFQAHLS